jgi:hypothetical protein
MQQITKQISMLRHLETKFTSSNKWQSRKKGPQGRSPTPVAEVDMGVIFARKRHPPQDQVEATFFWCCETAVVGDAAAEVRDLEGGIRDGT